VQNKTIEYEGDYDAEIVEIFEQMQQNEGQRTKPILLKFERFLERIDASVDTKLECFNGWLKFTT
jgi:hypothetical protein